jgi:mRNA interferase RelE/StbE
VTHRVCWSVPALDRAAGFLRIDPAGLSEVMDGVDGLGADPYGGGSVPLGVPTLRRARIGRYRVLYELEGDELTVVHVGRIG